MIQRRSGALKDKSQSAFNIASSQKNIQNSVSRLEKAKLTAERKGTEKLPPPTRITQYPKRNNEEVQQEEEEDEEVAEDLDDAQLPEPERLMIQASISHTGKLKTYSKRHPHRGVHNEGVGGGVLAPIGLKSPYDETKEEIPRQKKVKKKAPKDFKKERKPTRKRKKKQMEESEEDMDEEDEEEQEQEREQQEQERKGTKKLPVEKLTRASSPATSLPAKKDKDMHHEYEDDEHEDEPKRRSSLRVPAGYRLEPMRSGVA